MYKTSNIIKKIRFSVSLFFFIFSPLWAAVSSFEEAREECRGIYKASIAAEEDTRLWADTQITTLPTLSDEEIVNLVRAQCPPCYLEKTPPQMRESLQTVFTGALASAQQNIKTYQGFLEVLEDLTPDTVEPYLTHRLRSTLKSLDNRVRNSKQFPRTFPSDMETHSPINKKLAEEAVLRWDNEALTIKTFSRILPSSKLEKIFNPFVSHELYGGHFLVLHTYVLDLIPTPPLPDHYQYRVRHNLVEALRGNPLAVFVVPGAVQEVEKARAQLAGPLKEIKEVEDSAKIMLEQYKKEQGQAETVLIKKALEELTSHIIDELYRETVKAENKRARKKAAERRKKEEARKAKSMATSVETTTEQSSAETLPLGPSTAQLQLGSAEGEPFDQHISGQKIQPATDLPLASEPSSESEQEEEETFKYQPFVKQSSPQGASSSDEASPTTAPAASMTRLTLKPRIHQLWETFWAPGIRWMEWKDFMQLFMHQNLGFGIQPVGGSVRNILYPSSLLPSRTGRDHFIVHEPHGRTTLGPSTIRSIQTKLAEDFGWSSETFQAE